jgi:RNA polymerase sigma factor (sigma-70 family)
MNYRTSGSEKNNPEINSSYTEFFNTYFDVLYNYGMRLTKDEDLVKDCIQELFFRIWKNKIDYSSVKAPKSYLLKSLRNQILNVLELKDNANTKVVIEDSLLIEYSPEDYYIDNQQEEITRARVVKAINQLPQKQKEVIYLHFFENLSYDEIAEIMKINIQSVKNNAQRAYSDLRHFLNRLSQVLFSLVFA